MSDERLIRDYLVDILESIQDITDFTKGMDIDQFSVDRKTVKAVIRLSYFNDCDHILPQTKADKIRRLF